MKKILLITFSLVLIWNIDLSASGFKFPRKSINNQLNNVPTNSSLKLTGFEPQSYPGQGLFLNLSPVYSRIYNKSIYDDVLWKSDGGIGYTFDIGFFFRIKRYVGFGIGLGMSQYKSEIGFDYYYTKISTVDCDNDSVEKTIEVSNLAQKTTLLNADLPVFIEIGNPNTHKINYYVRLGVKFSYPLTYEFTTNGTTTIDGYYPDYFVLLHDIPELGFETNKTIIMTNETQLGSINISAFASAGMTVPISDYLILKIGANLNYGLTEIISEDKLGADDVSFYTGNYNSLLMAPDGKTVLQSAGLEVGIIYILQSKF